MSLYTKANVLYFLMHKSALFYKYNILYYRDIIELLVVLITAPSLIMVASSKILLLVIFQWFINYFLHLYLSSQKIVTHFGKYLSF